MPGLISPMGRNADKQRISELLKSSLYNGKGFADAAVRMATVSPRTKKQKTMHTIQQNINATLEEIKNIQQLMNRENEARYKPRLQAAESQLDELYEERDAFKNEGRAKDAVRSNLNTALDKCDEDWGKMGE